MRKGHRKLHMRIGLAGCVLGIVALQAVSAVLTESAERGRREFVAVGCWACHGTEAQGTSVGPRLVSNPWPRSAFAAVVRNPPGVMPPYSEQVLNEQRLDDIYAFVMSMDQQPASDAVLGKDD